MTQQSKELGPQAILGGNPSRRGSYDWIVSLQDATGHFCAGALISENAVVTAAHCVEGSASSLVRAIVVREHLLRSDDGEEVGISQIFLHPDFEAETNDSDLALLLLEQPISLSPIRYLQRGHGSLIGEIAKVLGWGSTREDGTMMSQLHEVHVPIVANSVANERGSHD